MATPHTLLAADTGVHISVDAPGTGESYNQALAARYIQPLLDSIYSLSLHKADSEDVGGATEAYVDDRVRQVRNVKKTAGTYTIGATDEVIEAVTTSGTLTLNLSSYTNSNKNLIVVADQGKNAGVNAIILHPEAGKAINGGTAGANLSLTTSGGTWTMWPLADNSGYWVTGPL